MKEKIKEFFGTIKKKIPTVKVHKQIHSRYKRYMILITFQKM